MPRSKGLSLVVLCLCLSVACTPRGVQSQASRPQATGASQVAQATPTSQAPIREPDVQYVPTPMPVVAEMLRMANVKQGDVLYDLGSGDGRIPIMAAREYGIRAVGIDIDPQRIAEANENARAAGVTQKVRFIQGDLFEADFSEATVVTLYLLNSLNERLRPKLLRDLKPRTRIVSHDFDMGDWQPEKTAYVNGSRIYLWTVPAR
jgi:SAM-dependent methyltransferase